MSATTKKPSPARRMAAPALREPTHDEIALCAVSIWEAEGRPQGRELDHWLLAEARLRQGGKATMAGKNGSKRSAPRSPAF